MQRKETSWSSLKRLIKTCKFEDVCVIRHPHSQKKDTEKDYFMKTTMWNADLGNGMYKNPILYADYSDPDACHAGEDYL